MDAILEVPGRGARAARATGGCGGDLPTPSPQAARYAGRVLVLPAVPPHELMAWSASADVMVMPIQPIDDQPPVHDAPEAVGGHRRGDPGRRLRPAGDGRPWSGRPAWASSSIRRGRSRLPRASARCWNARPRTAPRSGRTCWASHIAGSTGRRSSRRCSACTTSVPGRARRGDGDRGRRHRDGHRARMPPRPRSPSRPARRCGSWRRRPRPTSPLPDDATVVVVDTSLVLRAADASPRVVLLRDARRARSPRARPAGRGRHGARRLGGGIRHRRAHGRRRHQPLVRRATRPLDVDPRPVGLARCLDRAPRRPPRHGRPRARPRQVPLLAEAATLIAARDGITVVERRSAVVGLFGRLPAERGSTTRPASQQAMGVRARLSWRFRPPEPERRLRVIMRRVERLAAERRAAAARGQRTRAAARRDPVPAPG